MKRPKIKLNIDPGYTVIIEGMEGFAMDNETVQYYLFKAIDSIGQMPSIEPKSNEPNASHKHTKEGAI